MGRYFGLINVTKEHKVSGSWKGSPPGDEEMELIINLLGWEVGDEIMASCYDSGYKWNWQASGEWGDEKWVDQSDEDEVQEVQEEVEEVDVDNFTGFDWDGETITSNFNPTFFCN